MMSSPELLEYLSQLSAVEEALKNATGEQLSDLLDLKSKLCEVISLLQGTQKDESNRESTNSMPGAQDMDDEFSRFQMEIANIDPQTEQSLSSSESEDSSDNGVIPPENHELSQLLSSLEGSKCRAPFSREWGEMDYHNAMIISAECDLQSSQSLNQVLVKVMFCNPVCEEMKPCTFLLSGYCKYPDDRCRFSHGHEVKFSELQEFSLPDFNSLKVDSPCLAKGSNDIWCKATVERCMDEERYLVKHERTGKTCTLDAVDILPLSRGEDTEYEYNNGDANDQRTDESCLDSSSEPTLSVPILAINMPAGTWEQYTKGIGSKLMEKMGHIWGQGLGKNSDGRLDPVEAVILPTGKSLDKCVEMREKCNPKGPVALETRLELDQDREEQKAKRLKLQMQQAPRKGGSVFDFLNSRISTISSDGRTLDIRKNPKLQQQPASSKNLNVQIFSVGEDLRKAKKELARLKQTLVRNTGRNEVLRSQVEKKIVVQNEVIRNLQVREQKLGADIKSQTNHKKLTIF